MMDNRTSNAKQAAWVAFGSFFSFAVGIISPMILSRFFDKGDYGTYNQVMYIYNTLLVIFTLGLPKAYAYFLPKYAIEYSRDVISKITKIFFILGSIFSLCLLFCAGPIALVMKNPDLRMALIVFSPTPFFLLPTMGLEAIYASFRKTKYLAYYTVIIKILTIVCIVLPVVVFSGSYIHAIVGFDVASLITFIIALYLKSWPTKGIDSHKSNLTYKKILEFSLPLLYASLWGVIMSSASQFFISRYYGNEAFADFSSGFMEVPFVSMIVGAISTVLLPVFSGKSMDDGLGEDAMRIWNSALLKSAKLTFPMLIFCVVFAKQIMICMYGNMYVNSATYFIIKNLISLFCIIPFYPILLAIGKTKEYAQGHMIAAIVIVIADYIVCKTTDSAIYVVLVSELCRLFMIWFFMKIIADFAHKKISDLVPPKTLFTLLGLSLIAAIPPFVLQYFTEVNKFVSLLISLLLFIVGYYGLCWIFRITYRDIADNLMTGKLQGIVKFLP